MLGAIARETCRVKQKKSEDIRLTTRLWHSASFEERRHGGCRSCSRSRDQAEVGSLTELGKAKSVFRRVRHELVSLRPVLRQAGRIRYLLALTGQNSFSSRWSTSLILRTEIVHSPQPGLPHRQAGRVCAKQHYLSKLVSPKASCLLLFTLGTRASPLVTSTVAFQYEESGLHFQHEENACRDDKYMYVQVVGSIVLSSPPRHLPRPRVASAQHEAPGARDPDQGQD